MNNWSKTVGQMLFLTPILVYDKYLDLGHQLYVSVL